MPGRFDGFWEIKLKSWDVAAGALIVREAGGLVSDFAGNNFVTNPEEILASNGKIHSAMLEVIQKTARLHYCFPLHPHGTADD
ncbi:MAG: inositol monophosphatase family protein [Pseudomonadota bacterium]